MCSENRWVEQADGDGVTTGVVDSDAEQQHLSDRQRLSA
jgi:hypothetical protein